MNNVLQILKKDFGFDQFREGQLEIIQSILSGRDVLAVLPTGSGKTLCYHLPAKIFGGLTVIVSPLVSLMEDQVTQIRANGDKAVAHISSLISPNERKEILKNIQSYHMIFLSPEMLALPFIKQKLISQQVSLFVVDEAHCISQWGHEFRTDYLRLNDVRRELGGPPCMALTATATPEVEQDIRRYLEMQNESVYRAPVNRSNIYMAMETVKTPREKDAFFLDVMKKINHPTVVYTGTRKGTVYYANLLQKEGFLHVAFYHGGMTKEDRLLIQQQFIRDEVDVICCTNAFGMGINKPNIRSVIHLNLPSSIEQYVQEIGRAGRDQEQSLALLINSEEDRFLPISFIENEFPNETWLDHMLSGERIDGLAVEEVRQLYQIDETQWKMLMFYLEKENVIKKGYFDFKGRTNTVLAKIKKHFTRRQNDKITQLNRMNNLLHSKECIRNNISYYFGDDVQNYSEMTWCCSACQEFDSYVQERKGLRKGEAIKTQIESNSHQESWRDRLQSMLLRRNGDKNSE
ncbi:RecQ family ATP-dependent DNA helicase [Salipaludibacillus daqingensis]|uniref:RecQ family ATP-dependent DNA helicase n=1 Tax=Salipaludibacillus daqingensis TaxID=3041001 RepID=UPI00247574F5|nr:ATP-dependent DNA helicase RecQ [Salipaludibacillus daqingensis]